MKKIVLTFGLIAGAILSLMMLITVPLNHTIGWDHGEVIGYTTMVLAFLLIYFGVRSYRDLVGGQLSFGRAFAVGAMITVVSSACYVATWELVYTRMWPNFVTDYQAHAVEKVKASGASQAEVDKKVAEMQRFAELYKNPLINVGMTFLEPLPIGLIIALISAGILRKRRDRRASELAPA